MNTELIISISAVVVSFVSCIIPLVIQWRYRKRDKKDDLTKRLDAIIKLGLQYPYMEDRNFTSKWNESKGNGDERYLRYDNYCNILYNYLHSVCEHFNYDKKEIENYIDIKNWIRMHKQNWENPTELYENVDGYDVKFRRLIDEYLK